MYISDYLGNLSKKQAEAKLEVQKSPFQNKMLLCQLFAITAAQNVSACITGVADGVNEL